MSPTKTRPERTVVPPPHDDRMIPHFIDVPPELEGPAEAVRAAIVRQRQTDHAASMAGRALEAAENLDRLAAATAGPASLPAATKPQREREFAEATRAAQAARDALTLAVRAQSAAIGPVVKEWREQHERQVRERTELAESQIDALVQTLSEVEGDVALDEAMRDYDPNVRSGWRLHYRTPDVLRRHTDKAEARLRSKIDSLGHPHQVSNEVESLLAALRVKADAWATKREAERRATRRDEIVREETARGHSPTRLNAAIRDRLRAENLAA